MSTVDKNQFIELLSKHLNEPIEKVEKQFNEVINEITSVSKGSPLAIDGLGVFRLKKGRLSFESDPAFAVEINYKYAGMQPIEIRKSGDKKGDDETAQTVEISTQTEEDKTELVIGKVTQSAPKVVESEKVEEKVAEQKSEEPAVNKDSLKPEQVEPEKITQPPKEVVSKKPQAPVNKGYYKQQSSNWKLPVSIAAALAVIAFVSWFLTRSANEMPAPAPTVEKTVVTKVEKQELEPKSEPEVKPKEVVSDVVADLTETTKTVEENKAQKPIEYGLNGDFNPEIKSSYAIVIYTLSVESRAHAEVSDWTKKGYRAYVHGFDTSTRRLFYVALGQFATIPDAKNAVSSLPNGKNTPGNYTIKRITQ
ncbi:hypothetical protein EP331_08540 [bacterium]|nr:MAG: hypothetical protein EP331_08540 [bacterium]